MRTRLLDWILAADDPDEEHDDGDDKQDVDEPADGVRRNESEEPEDEQYCCDGDKHGMNGA